LRQLEQTVSDPLREFEALGVSLYKHSVFITNEIALRYNGEISKRLIELAPIVMASSSSTR
jgi:hypothetical protein